MHATGPTRLRRPNPTRIRTTPRKETRQPAAGGGGQTLPLLKVVGVAHGCVAPTADGNQIGKGERTAFALGDVVSDVEIKHADAIGAPAGRALVCKGVSKSFAPQLFPEGLGDGGLSHSCNPLRLVGGATTCHVDCLNICF
jgi:hypothetical protein